MKKLLAIIVLGLLWNNVGFASLIEYEKCYTDYENKDSNWKQESYEKKNNFIILKKDAYQENLETLSLTNTQKESFGARIDKNPELDYINIFLHSIDKKQSEKLKAIGGQVHKHQDKNLYSIDADRGYVTFISIDTDQYVKTQRDEWEKRGDTFKFMYQKTKSRKYKIKSYAGGIIIAYQVYDFGLSSTPITIDLKNKSITDILDKDTYKYLCKNASSKNTESQGSSGSGFFINNKGYFVTNNHVVKGCKQSKITFKGESIDAEIIATDQTLDLALMKANVKPKNYLNLSDEPPEKLQKIYVAGYPFGKGLSDDLKLTQGIISSVKGYKDNSNQIQIDAAINSGNSGGPIVNEDGDLVGVAVSGLNKSKSEGIAFGIKSAAVKNFLDVNKIKYSTSSLMNFGMSNKKLNNLLEDSAVYTFCN